MQNQTELDQDMRAVLVDWIIEIHYKFGMSTETLFLTVNLIDRYLEINLGVISQDLQVIGAACLLIASKYEEIFLPSLSDLVELSDFSFTTEQIIQTEVSI